MPSIKVMSWNIQDLGLAKVNWTGPGETDPATKELILNSYTIEYIVSVILKYELDVLAVMEVRGFQANKIRSAVVSMLTKSGMTWKGEISSQQPDKNRKEQYIYFWNTNCPGIASLNPAAIDAPSPCWLHSVVDDNSMSAFFDSLGAGVNTSTKRKEIYSALVTSGYIALVTTAVAEEKANVKQVFLKKRLRDGEDDDSDDEDHEEPSDDGSGEDEEDVVVGKKQQSNHLTTSQNTISLAKKAVTPFPENEPTVNAYYTIGSAWADIVTNSNTPLPLFSDKEKTIPVTLDLSPAQLTVLRQTLIKIDIIQFPAQGFRSPFILHLTLAGAAAPNNSLTLAVIHVPGPEDDNSEAGDKTKFPGINNLALSGAFINSPNLLLMGDFNIQGDEFCETSVLTFERSEKAGDSGFKIVQETTTDSKTSEEIKKPKETTLPNPFGSIESGLKATKIFKDGDTTSLTTAEAILKRHLSLADFNAITKKYMANPYDKFFLKMTPDKFFKDPAGKVVDLIEAASPVNPALSTPMVATDQNMAEALMKVYRAKVNQASVQNTITSIINRLNKKLKDVKSNPTKKKLVDSTLTVSGSVDAKRTNAAIIINTEAQQITEAIDNIQSNWDVVIEQLFDATSTVPASVATAFIAYRRFSDHLPISIELQYDLPVNIVSS
jgi:hypothetical protein